MTRRFIATKVRVFNRGVAPDSFLNEAIDWGRKAPDDIFAPNSGADIYGKVKNELGPWTGLLHRKAAMLEVMRVHAGLESSWNWNEGVDKTNATSQRNITGQETGVFQVSFDSLHLDHGYSLSDCLLKYNVPTGPGANQSVTPGAFIGAIKRDHFLALEYYARLVRLSVAWAGPLLRHGADSIYPWLSRAAVAEFEGFLK